ncbi:MAG: ABC-F family ATP-binding cassette domain-containing protein [Chlamydiales bacterium]|nr:ABC-F family ATP-binding cassette domain-containing protein [Chlamydiales bacterium]
MSLLLNTQSLEKSFGSEPLFRDLCFSIFSGNRIGLIGPNGAGKSTLLKILAGVEFPDRGSVSSRKDLKIGYVAQMQEFPDKSPFEILLEQTASEHTAKAWLSKMGFQGNEESAQTLSGGWKKRLAIALELMKGPDILLLDEPTNHLDLEGVFWLETFLLKEATTFVLVSHDRYFLQKMTNRTIEINKSYPGGVFSIDGSFERFLEKKGQFLEGQIQQQRSIGSKVRREREWMRQTPKARTSKSQARLGQAAEIFSEHAELKKRNTQKAAKIQFEATERETRKLLVAKNLGYHSLFKNLDITLSPGARLGLIGPNGSGKTTLMRLLARELVPSQGTIKEADALKIVYFDQHREQLPLHLTLREALSPNGDYVTYHGVPIHVNGWCKRFLFSPSSLEMPLEKLSGGERARIAVARLMLQPADILLLDEPTNDLDIPTLETLEENLIDFPGAVVLITHDRYLLERTCNRFLCLKSGVLYSAYRLWESEPRKKAAPPQKRSEKRDSSKQKREAEQIEKQIAEAEEKLAYLNTSLPTEDLEKLQAACRTIADLERKIEHLYSRWSEIVG